MTFFEYILTNYGITWEQWDDNYSPTEGPGKALWEEYELAYPEEEALTD